MKKTPYLRLLKHRSFMSFWGATTLMRMASNVLQFAVAIYVLDLTGSALAYSGVLSIILIPRLLCTSAAGYFADFMDSAKILRRGTFVLAALMAAFLAVHMLILPLNLILIDMLVIGLELCETFLSPAEGKLLPCIVMEEEIAPASKLSSLDDGIVEILSPVVGGAAYGFLGLTSVLGIALFMEILAFFMAANIQYRKSPESGERVSVGSLRSAGNAYRETVRCLKENPHVIGIILLAPLFNFFVNPLFSVAAPHYFRVKMDVGVEQYALFNTALGAAGLIAPFLAMVLIDDKAEYRANEGGTMACAVVLLGLAGILRYKKGGISSNGSLYLVTGGMMLMVAIITMMNIASVITVKKSIPEAIMGRMISLIQLCATVSVPLGQLFYGLCADCLPITSLFLIASFGLWAVLAIMVRTYRAIHTEGE